MAAHGKYAALHRSLGRCRYKCAPPLREGANRVALLQGLAQGVIDSVATDHSPSGAPLRSAVVWAWEAGLGISPPW